MRMQYRLAYQTSTLTDDTMGGSTEAWSTVRTIYADIEEEDGTRQVDSGEIRYYKRYTIKCRKQKNLTIDPDGRLLYGSKVLVIESVLEKKKKFLEIEAHGDD